MSGEIGETYDQTLVERYLWSHLEGGRANPGYSYAVLLKPDLRFEALVEFDTHQPNLPVM